MLKVTVIGHLGQDAILKEFQNAKYAAFSVAHSESWKDQQGVKHEKTEWVSCFRKIHGESTIVQYLTKGTKVYVEGSLSKKVYEKNGKYEAGLNCNVAVLELLSSKKDEVQVEPLKAELNPIKDTSAPIPEVGTDDLPF